MLARGEIEESSNPIQLRRKEASCSFDYVIWLLISTNSQRLFSTVIRKYYTGVFIFFPFIILALGALSRRR